MFQKFWSLFSFQLVMPNRCFQNDKTGLINLININIWEITCL